LRVPSTYSWRWRADHAQRPISSTISSNQRGTSMMSGSIVAAVRPDGTAVVLTTSRSGESSGDELAADAELLEAILAHL
jgi:hypothetical protein